MCLNVFKEYANGLPVFLVFKIINTKIVCNKDMYRVGIVLPKQRPLVDRLIVFKMVLCTFFLLQVYLANGNTKTQAASTSLIISALGQLLAVVFSRFNVNSCPLNEMCLNIS